MVLASRAEPRRGLTYHDLVQYHTGPGEGGLDIRILPDHQGVQGYVGEEAGVTGVGGA